MIDERQGAGPDSHAPDAAGAPPARGKVSRRIFLRVSAATGLAAGATAAACAGPAEQRGPVPQARLESARGGTPSTGADGAGGAHGAGPDVLLLFTAEQAAVVEAMAARIIPTDDNGPGATEAGVVSFIDRQLAQTENFRPHAYRQGPFLPGLPTQGDQSALSIRDRYRIGIAAVDEYARRRFNAGFAALNEQQQDALMRDMEVGRADEALGRDLSAIQTVPVELAGIGPEAIQHASPNGKVFGLQAFFAIVRGHTIAGFLSDPIHGGNRDMVGWKLIGFPGAQIGGYRDWILNYGVPFPGAPSSLADYHRASGLRPEDGAPGPPGAAGAGRGHGTHGGGR